ncbi:Putative Competence protein ComGF [Thermoflavimicrobium dichotomicum]|uniref:Putative Competence protein ComGF n=2 Tax=Thermoflavimicrobium dichotomicum TaxID=46223 RepID=A0A1I3NCS8_9BACL|nr:Putative Competence protein ComGF [Thermoflavimicrobium dichotomicum]
MEYRAFLSYVQNEVKQGAHFRTENGALLFELPSGETIRYEQKNRQVIRRVKKANEKHFKGTMILLQHVYLILFIPDKSGVLLDVGLQSWSADLEMKIYIHGRSRVSGARN